MDSYLSGNAPRRAGETQEKRHQYPVRERPFPLMQQGIGQVIEGTLAAVAPVTFASGAVVVRPLRIDVLALAPGTLERVLFPPERMDVGLTVFGVEELVDV